ncbi:MAG: hypothetical protein Q9M09_01700 [Mariprofundaceae bacterium]|nr:hypothetical protein [Mariprofundaceae bacterium]
MKRASLLLLSCLLFGSAICHAEPAEAYQQALALAAQGDTRSAIAMLRGAESSLPPSLPIHARIHAAAVLLSMQQHQQQQLPDPQGNFHLILASRLLQHLTPPTTQRSLIPATLGAIFPGAGHAWLGRWHDALTAALLVFPMLLLSIWAWRRAMGPVTVFFSLITLWLWSGTVFSALSLAERANYITYLTWWQSLWQAAALPGHAPW